MSDVEKLLLTICVLVAYGVFCWACFRSYRSLLPKRSHSVVKPQIAPASGFLVAYASQSGLAVYYANQVVGSLVESAQVLSLDRVDDKVLASVTRVLFIVSTYGEGEPPDNGVRFARRYLTASAKDLSHLTFAVLALGDRSYQYFCGFGYSVYQGLKHHGASPLFPVVELDAQSDQSSEAGLSQWYQQLRGCGIQFKLDTANAQRLAVGGEYDYWRLTHRTQVNSGSPGEPLYFLRLQQRDGAKHSWSAGDIAEITPRNFSTQRTESSEHVQLANREYSIASITEDGSLEFLVRQQQNPDGSFGLASGWLTVGLELQGEVELKIRNNPLFRAPEEDIPLILIGNGSGYSGLRAVLKEREKSGLHKNWLFFGERSPHYDRIFNDEIEAWRALEHLQKVNLTFSRCPDNPAYVQQALLAEKDLEDWISQGAVVMVCGSKKGMAEGVDAALRQVLSSAVVEELQADGRYRRDVY